MPVTDIDRTALAFFNQRSFVFKGKPHAREGVAPAGVEPIAARIDSPFDSVDVALNRQGQLRLIELGDGQVSDRKQWGVEPWLAMFRGN
jgi:hypothetical protein